MPWVLSAPAVPREAVKSVWLQGGMGLAYTIYADVPVHGIRAMSGSHLYHDLTGLKRCAVKY